MFFGLGKKASTSGRRVSQNTAPITAADLAQYKFKFVLDTSGSMDNKDGTQYSRWQRASEFTTVLTAMVEGIGTQVTGYTFDSSTERLGVIDSGKVAEIFSSEPDGGGTYLGGCLKVVLGDIRKELNDPNSRNMIIIVTDGEPHDGDAAMREIVNITQHMSDDRQLAIAVLRVGGDRGAAAYCKALDDDLEGMGARFDIVDTRTLEEALEMDIEEFLVMTVND